jgi:uncharacterized ion transporter superfamily protein YfcC
VTLPRFPHPLVLLVGFIALAAVLTHVLPSGAFDRRDDPVAGRSVVVAGTYHRVDPAPVSAFDAVVAIPRGMADAASVVFLVFLVGGAFAVVERTGALDHAVRRLVRALAHREVLVVPVCCVAFGLGGILIQMQEELIAFVPVLLLLTRSLGFDRTTAIGMSMGAAVVGAAFSPIDPFMVGIAQKVAGLPLLSGQGFRYGFLVPALALWTLGTMRHATRTRSPASAGEPAVELAPARRPTVVLLLVLVTFALFVTGVMRWGWDFDQMAALFFVMGVTAGLIAGLGVEGTAEAFVGGFRSMAYAALLVGFARAIFVILEDGRIIDTVVQGLFTPLSGLPVTLSALGMMGAHGLLHIPVPSTSGQAVLTMPLLVPLSDLLGLSRQVAVLAYQYGAGLADVVNPTNGALLAMLGAAGVRYEHWFRFAAPLVAGLAVLAAAAIVLAIAIGLR